MTRLALALLALACGSRLTAADRPNVLIVLTDDQGMGDFSFTGNPVLKTPNLDRFAKEAVRFTDFHVCPMCTPTRGQLMTGVDAVRNGATSVTAGRSFPRRQFPMMPEIFAASGYKTGLFGKWHLGDHYPYRPTDRGFHEARYHLGWGMLNAAPEFDNPLIDGRFFHNGKPEKFAGHCTDFWFDSATAWMKERKANGEPFLCYLPTNAPHAPFVELDEYVKPYQGKKVPAGFFGMIAHIDRRFGDLEKFLAESGLRENTIVIFMTDNGGTAGVATFNAGLRAGKTTYYDGGHRVPCWVRWPAGKLGEPRDIPTPAQVQDILPTLMEVCDLPIPKKAAFDGTSLAGLLRDPSWRLPDRTMVVQYSRDTLAKWDSCVIRGKWRLVKGEELYDIEADREQKTDLAAKHPEVVKVMRDHYEKWWAELEPKVKEYEPCAYLGSEKEPEVALTSADWEGIYADNTGHVRSAVGGPTGGHWHVFVETAGEYEIALRRWPRETKAALGAKYDDPAGGKKAESRAFPVAGAVVRIAGVEATAKAAPTDGEAVVRVKLPAGKTTLKAWFRDDKGTDLCGAFFAYVRRAEGK